MVKHTLKKYSPEDRLFIARNANDGVEYINKSLNSSLDLIPSLTIIDLDSPETNGLYLIQRVTSDLRIQGMQVAVFTSPLGEQDAKRFNNLGIDYVLQSPFEHKAVKDLLETASFETDGAGGEVSASVSSGALPYRQPKIRVLDADEFRQVLVIEGSAAERKRMLQGLNHGGPITFDFATSWSVGKRKFRGDNYSAVILSVNEADSEKMVELLTASPKHKNTPVIALVDPGSEHIGKAAVLAGAKLFIVRDSGNYLSIVNEMLVNMVERRRLEILINRANDADKEMLRDVIERAPLMMVRIDETFAIKDCNETFASASKLLRHTLIGKHIFDILPDLEVLPMISVLEERLPYSRESFRMKTIGQTHTATTYWDFHVWSIKRSIISGQEAMLIASDVSGRVELELQRERFVAALAHDIRNPLVGGQRVIDSILNGKHGEVEPPRAKQLITALNKSNQSLLLMLSNLIDVYKYETSSMNLQFRRLNLPEIVREQIQEVRHVAGTIDVEIEEKIADNIPEVPGDINSIRRLLMNLLHNAIKYCASGTKIEVRLYAIGPTFVSLRIKNTGSPIAAEKMRSLFRSVVDGVPIRHGSGLGLYLCRKIIEAHSASIDCQSTSSGITELRVNFNIIEENEPDSHSVAG
jgi:signal transduction histidine kinase/CheY-like chemotaxis protein